ncbi:MAG: hypothetical protein M1831_004165 [Alyxoria varia]|nr:MAG: hypothetical protein M1831_004165 [Alyxoria varia]
MSGRSKAQNETLQSLESSRESNTPDQHAHDRLLFLMANFVGNQATVTAKNGDRFSGIFSGVSLESSESRYVLKMVRKLPNFSDDQANGTTEASDLIGNGDDHAMTFSTSDVADLSAENISIDKASSKLTNGASSFRTDTDISGNMSFRERDLTPWQPSTSDDVDLTLSGRGNTAWDQFETNERLYGVTTDYDENLYTTSIDRSHPSYKDRAAAADRKAREIEVAAGHSHAHAAETEDGTNEEERYDTVVQHDMMERAISHLAFANLTQNRFSGVKRDLQSLSSSNPNRYTPPARRPPTGQATVPGAPVDPAIITSQLVKPEGSSTPQPTKSSTPTPALPATASTKKDNKESSTTAGGTDPSTVRKTPEPSSSKVEVNDHNTIKPTPIQTVNRPPKSPMNATETVERDVLKAFKDFGASEKMKAQERSRAKIRSERDTKFNELKNFSASFKLPGEVPRDMLGILAKDKEKQQEIVKKSLKSIEEQKYPPKAPASQDERINNQSRSTGTSRPEAPHTAATTSHEQPNTRSGPKGRGGSHNTRGDRSGFSSTRGGGGPTGFGQRMMQQPQYASRPPANMMPMQDVRMPAAGPAAISTDLPAPRGSITSPGSASSTRFNAQAIEFRPNPASTNFTPTVQPTAPPQSARSSVSKSRQPAKASFFGDKRPKPSVDQPAIGDDFNPIKRMKKEAEAEGKTKDFAPNGGIPQAYRTPPTWDVRDENRDKSYVDMFDKPPPSVQSQSPANGPMPHQHQLPFHLQPGAHQMPPTHTPQHTPRHHSYAPAPQNRDHHFDDHRMHASTSGSSHYPSPRYQQSNAMPHSSPMMSNAQPAYGPPAQMPPYVYGPQGQRMQFVGHMPNHQQFGPPQGQMGGGPMMPNSSPYMVPVNAQGVPMYGPPQNQGMPGHVSGPQTPNGFPSPQTAPVMVNRGSQQGHGPQPMYMSPSQQGQNMYGQQMMMPMRGGMPMPQPGYGSSPHMQHQYPAGGTPQQHHRHPHGGGGPGPGQPFPNQYMPPHGGHPMGPHQGPPPTGPGAMMGHAPDHDDGK